MDRKILLIGSSAKEYALAKYLSKDNEVFIAPGNDAVKEFATCVDIRENSSSELLEFVMENGIDMTVAISRESLNTDIVELFNNNNQQIFAPSFNASRIVYDKAFMKKTLYKLRIPTPKFGIFEKSNMALDYIKNLNNPFVLKTDEPSSAIVLSTAKEARNIIESYFDKKNQRILIEDYIWGIPFCYYVVTDGYKALPIGSSIIYKHTLEGDGGQLTSGMGAISPNYKLSSNNELFLTENVVYPILEYLERGNNPYTGILGVKGILTDDGSIFILGFQPFTHDCDTTGVLASIDMNLYNIFESCTMGTFSDDVDFINLSDRTSVSLVLRSSNKNSKNNIIEGLDKLDDYVSVDFYKNVRKNKYLEYEAEYGPNLVLTSFSRTLTTASQKVYEEVKNINFAGICYRTDICRNKDN